MKLRRGMTRANPLQCFAPSRVLSRLGNARLWERSRAEGPSTSLRARGTPKSAKILDTIDVAARYFVYKAIQRLLTGQPKRRATLRGMPQNGRVMGGCRNGRLSADGLSERGGAASRSNAKAAADEGRRLARGEIGRDRPLRLRSIYHWMLLN